MKPSSAKTWINPRTKRLIVFAFFCVLLSAIKPAGCDYFRDGKTEYADGRLVAPAARSAKISMILIRRPGEETIRLALEDSGWMLQSPHLFPADDARVEALIWTIGRLRSESVLLSPGPSEKARFGLNEPCLELDFGAPGRPVTKLSVGCKKKENLLAIELSGDKDVHLVKTDLESLGGLKHEFFMSPLVLDVDIPNLESIEVHRPGEETLNVYMDKDREWVIAGGWGVLPADPEKAYNLAKKLTGLRSASVVSPGVDKKQGDTIRIKLKTASKSSVKPMENTETAATSHGAEYEVFVSGSCPEKPELLRMVRTKPYPAEFCVEKKIFSEIDFSPSRFLDPRPIRAESTHIESFEWQVKGGTSFSLVADRAGGWEITWNNRRRPADSGIVRKKMGLLSQNHGVSFKKLEEKHRRTHCIKYSPRGVETLNSLCLTDSPAPEAHVAVVRDDEPLALIVTEEIGALLLSTPVDFYDRVLFSHNLPNLPDMVIMRNGVRESLVRVGTRHELGGPVFGPPDSASYSRLSSLFSRFAVKEFLPDGVSHPDLKKPELIMEVRPEHEFDLKQVSTFSDFVQALSRFFETGSMALRLEIGKTTEGGECRGRMEERTFVMDRKSCEILKTPLASLRILNHLAGEMITGMTFCKNNSCMVFQEESGKWTLVSKSVEDESPTQSSIRNLLAMTRGVTALEVDRYTTQSKRPKAAGHICLTGKRREEAHLEMHQDGKTLMQDCLYLGSERFKINGRKVGQAWVGNRPVIYNLSADLIERLLKPF